MRLDGMNATKKNSAIKLALTKAHILISLEFSKKYLTFSFYFEDTIDGVLVQKNS